jgi:hypothetical protein
MHPYCQQMGCSVLLYLVLGNHNPMGTLTLYTQVAASTLCWEFDFCQMRFELMPCGFYQHLCHLYVGDIPLILLPSSLQGLCPPAEKCLDAAHLNCYGLFQSRRQGQNHGVIFSWPAFSSCMTANRHSGSTMVGCHTGSNPTIQQFNPIPLLTPAIMCLVTSTA